MITKSIKELHEDLLNKKITSKELIDESLEKCHSIQDKTNAFVTIIDDAKESEVTDELVSGIPYGIKDTEPLSYPFEMVVDDLRSDDEVGEEIPIEELLRNCDQYEGREVEVPKVVG